MCEYNSPLSPPLDVQTAFDQFRLWGAITEHFLFPAPSTPNKSIHQQAAMSALLTVIASGGQRAPDWTIGNIDQSKLVQERARAINPVQFMGTLFHFELKKPLLVFPGVPYPHPFDDAEGAHSRRREIIRDQQLAPYLEGETAGYVYAVLHPPYGLHHHVSHHRDERDITSLERGTAFLHLCDVLFGDLNTLDVYAWPTDCSDFFDAGHEWWGSSFWTVYSPAKKWIIAILASATD